MTLGLEHLPYVISAIGAILPFIRKCGLCEEKEIGVCVLKKSGLTSLVNAVESKRDKFHSVFVDIDERVNNSLTETERQQAMIYKTEDPNALRNLILPKLTQIKKECRKAFGGKRIFYFSSDVSILYHIKLRRIVSFVPSGRLLESILSPLDAELRDIILKNKNDVLQSDCPTLSYDTFEHLSQQFCQMYNLKMRL